MELLIVPGFWIGIGVLVKVFCPAFVPYLGIAKRTINELVELHKRSEEANNLIGRRAVDAGFVNAAKALGATESGGFGREEER